MDEKNLQNEIVEAAATKAADTVNQAVETKTAEINEKLEAKADAASVEKLATAIDKLSEKSFAIGAPKRTKSEEMFTAMTDGVNNLQKGQKVLFNTKDFGVDLVSKDATIAAGAGNYQAYSEFNVGDVKYDPNHATRMTNFLSVYSIPTSGAIRYNQESARTDNADVKAAGAALGSQTYTVQPVTEGANTAGAFVTVPIEHISEVNGMQSYITQRLMGDVMDDVDAQILNGSGSGNNWTGINVHAPTANRLTTSALADAFFGAGTDSAVKNANNYDVFTAVAAELEGLNFKPDTVVLNPVDYRALSWIKTAQGEYQVMQMLQAAQPFQYFQGLRIIPNAAQTQGSFSVFDSRAVGLFLENGITFEMGYNDDDFSSNNITAKAYMRGGVAGFRPNGIVRGTLSIAATSIDDAA